MKSNQKLILSIMALIITVVSLGTVTYAWFALNNEAKINQFDLRAASQTGIEMSVTDGTPNNLTSWYSAISAEHFLQVIQEKYNKTGYSKFDMSALTSNDGKDFYGFTNGKFNPEKVLESSGKYLSIQLNFRSKELGSILWDKVELKSELSEFESTVTGWYLLNGSLVEENTTTNHYLHHAVRVGMHSLTPGSTHSFVYEDFEQGTVTDGIPSNGNYVLGNGDSLALTTGQNGAHSYFGATRNDSLDISDVLVVQSTNINESPQVITDLIAGENDYYIGTVTLNIWIEGWDQNAIDAVFNAHVKISLGFKLI